MDRVIKSLQWNVLWSFFFLSGLVTHIKAERCENAASSVSPIPINMAEAIIEPFYDPSLSGLPNWSISPGQEWGLKVEQFWCWTGFEWLDQPEHTPALRMERTFYTNCVGYDKLILSVTVPEGVIVRVTLSTDCGTRRFESSPKVFGKQEYTIDLDGAQFIKTIVLEAEAIQGGLTIGWFNWIGLQNSSFLPRYETQWDRFDSRWEGYLKEESYDPVFEPAYGILISKPELADLRELHNKVLQKHGESYFTKSAKKAMEIIPEKQIGEYVNPGYDPFFVRNRDYNKVLMSKYFDPGSDAAVAGLLLKDKELLRLAARYAMSIGMCEHWDYGFVTHLPGGLFDSRAFVPSLASRQVAMILDLAGEMFTPLGREFLLRRL